MYLASSDLEKIERVCFTVDVAVFLRRTTLGASVVIPPFQRDDKPEVLREFEHWSCLIDFMFLRTGVVPLEI